MKKINLKKLLHYLSYPLFISSLLYFSFEFALKSGKIFTYRELFIPLMQPFFWRRIILFLLPSIVLIFLSAYKKTDSILKSLLLVTGPIVISKNIHIFSAYNWIPNLHQPNQLLNLYYFVSVCSAVLWISISTLGFIWVFQKDDKDLSVHHKQHPVIK